MIHSAHRARCCWLNKENLIDYIIETHGIDEFEITLNSPLFSSGLLDSIILLDLIEFIETKTGIKIRDSDITLENLDTIVKILGYISRRIEENLNAKNNE